MHACKDLDAIVNEERKTTYMYSISESGLDIALDIGLDIELRIDSSGLGLKEVMVTLRAVVDVRHCVDFTLF